MKLAVAAAALAVGAGGFTVTALPRPAFPGPVAKTPAAKRLVVLSSRYHAPAFGGVTFRITGQGIPDSFRGADRVDEFRQGDVLFALYGRPAASARYVLAFHWKTLRFRYGFDFVNYVWPPRIAPGEREFVYEEVVWAREASGTLYVENAHWTYARSSYGRNAYITAIDLKTKNAIWRSPALVSNANTFVVAGDYLVTGYGFTAEPDYLYLLVRRNGHVVERLRLPSAPERISRRGDKIFVRTYDHDVVVKLRRP